VIEFERLLEDEIQFNVTNREMRALTKRFDSDGNGRVDRREFLEFCKQHGYRRPAQVSSEDRRDLLRSAKKRSQQVFDEAVREIGLYDTCWWYSLCNF
jgi:hypothetical protein